MTAMTLWTNGADTFIARDATHAAELYDALNGEGASAGESFEWDERDDAPDPMTIHLDDGRGAVTQTIAEWIAESPEGGPLCSTEW